MWFVGDITECWKVEECHQGRVERPKVGQVLCNTLTSTDELQCCRHASETSHALEQGTLQSSNAHAHVTDGKDIAGQYVDRSVTGMR